MASICFLILIISRFWQQIVLLAHLVCYLQTRFCCCGFTETTTTLAGALDGCFVVIEVTFVYDR